MTMRDITGIFDDMVAGWHNYRAKLAALNELEAANDHTRSRIAGDLGIDPSTLHEVVVHGTGADRLMERMMADFGIDAAALRKADPAGIRDIEILCSQCASKGRCARELAAGTAVARAAAFCPNAETFRAFA